METEKVEVGNLNRVSGVDDGSSSSPLVRNEKIKDKDEEGWGNGEELVHCGFQVGDFVWVKLKSHPWWPGQVFDLRDASEFALKHSIEDRHLVAFFGDGSCSWCLPSQLIHFVKNFKEMSAVDGTSKSIINAIQGAVSEVGRLVESKMTCKCMPLEIRDGLSRPQVSNVGIKEGVLAPEVDINRLSVRDYEPDEILNEVMHFAIAVPVDNELEFAVLRSWLTAFYRARGGYQFQDNSEMLNEVSNDFSSPVEVPILGPQNNDDSTTANSAYSHIFSSDENNHRKKQRSIAELVQETSKVNPKKKRATEKEGKDVPESALLMKRKKSSDGEVEEGSYAEDSSPGKMRYKRIRVSKSPEVTSKKVLNAEDHGNRDMTGAIEGNSPGKPKKIEAAAVENTYGKSEEELEKLRAPRERKKSKYLCAPYTSHAWKEGNSSSKWDDHRKLASQDIQSTSPVSESADDEAFDDKLPEGRMKGLHTSVNMNPEIVKIDKTTTFVGSDVDVPVNKFLTEIESAAVNSLYLCKEGSLDMVWAFASAFRSSTYLHGLAYKGFQKCKTPRKRKSFPSKLGIKKMDLDQGDTKSEAKTPKAVKTERNPDVSSSKKVAKISIARNSADTDGNASCCLILTFSQEFPLPSKEEVVMLFGKFGLLNEKETNVAKDSHSVQVVYMKGSDAEVAFKSSISQRLFGIKNVVNYTLQYSLSGSHPKISSPHKQAPEKPGSSQSAADVFLPDVQVIRQKLDTMIGILEDRHRKISQDNESSLKEAMKNLLENVETVNEKVHVMAENSSS